MIELGERLVLGADDGCNVILAVLTLSWGTTTSPNPSLLILPRSEGDNEGDFVGKFELVGTSEDARSVLMAVF